MTLYDPLKLNEKIYSVSALNKQAKNLLTEHFSQIRVEGEISNLSTPSSGHIYFSLKDPKAQIRCAMFRSNIRRLKFKPEQGMHVIMSAQVSLYEARGDYQLIIDSLEKTGEGDLQIAFEKLKSKLQNEGLFDVSLKQSLPDIPQKIGLITSPTGAAVHDILTVLKRRFPTVSVVIYPTAVQGTTAKYEIIKAIEIANQQNQVDVILLARGGGSLEDLWAFNEESVARAIVDSKIAIISGIGHEVDFTIADFVADLRAPTPSVAAENAVPDQNSWLRRFQAIEQQLQQILQRKFLQQQQLLIWLNKRLKQQHPGQQLKHLAQSLDNLELRLIHSIQTKIKQQQSVLAIQSNGLQQHNPENKVIQHQQQLKYLSNRLSNAIQHKLTTLQNQHVSLVQTLNAVSPLATLERGYAIISNPVTNTVISSSQQLSINDEIKTRLADGQIISQVKEIQHD